MNNTQKVLEIIESKHTVTATELAQVLGVSRQYINQLLQVLLQDRKIVKVGSTRSARYVSAKYAEKHPESVPATFHARYENFRLEEHVVLQEIEEKFYPLSTLQENVRSMFTFAFSEMLNNAIEHSSSSSIVVDVAVVRGVLSFTVTDFGIGVFRNIMKKRKLSSPLEAVQDLLKGKTTTMPKSHSGEGIFFTSRVADDFVLNSFGYQLEVRDGVPEVKQVVSKKRGTQVVFRIATTSDRHLNDVFKEYSNLQDQGSYGFDKTEIRVKLFTAAGVHISRSQARRILSGLEKFRVIVLDFDQVPLVGQAFADEIYRVFQSKFPDIEIREENMTEAVRFMVERAKGEAGVQ